MSANVKKELRIKKVEKALKNNLKKRKIFQFKLKQKVKINK